MYEKDPVDCIMFLICVRVHARYSYFGFCVYININTFVPSSSEACFL
jgi:hypothetical protein